MGKSLIFIKLGYFRLGR